jgi:hypothetical protein
LRSGGRTKNRLRLGRKTKEILEIFFFFNTEDIIQRMGGETIADEMIQLRGK